MVRPTLVIRTEQLKAFQAGARAGFEEELEAALRRFWPAQCEDLDPDALRVRVRDGITAAAREGFTTRRDIYRYLNLTFFLGPGFADDERYPWARETLRDASLDSGAKLDRLGTLALTGRSE